MYAGPCLGTASELNVRLSAYRADAPPGWSLAGLSPYKSLQNLGTRANPARGWALYRLAHEAREGGWEIVFIVEGARAEEAAERIKALLAKPLSGWEVSRLSWKWLLSKNRNKAWW
jgi:hypothetical protein